VINSEGKGGERVIAISRFQGGSPPPVLIKDYVVLASMDKL
jgi:hypothetical protein